MDILKNNIAIREARAKGKADAVARYEEAMQLHICLYMDKDTRSASTRMLTKKTGGPRQGGVRSLVARLSGKRGRVRGNCMVRDVPIFFLVMFS